MNRTNLIGRLTKDPVTFDSANGKVAKFNMATKVGYDPEKKEDRMEFVPVTAFGLKDAFLEYLYKGRLVSVEGRVSTDSYEKDGETVWQTTVKCHNGGLQLQGAGKKDEETTPEAATEEVAA